MQLNDFQERFKALMLDHPDALDTPPEALAAFCAEGDIPLPERLKVYRNNIVGSLSDLMLSTFPITEKLVGHDFMELMVRSFILENPPSQGFLSLYGAGFAEFVEGFELAKSLPYLPDVVRLELAMNAAYYAKDDSPLKTTDLEKLQTENLENTVLTLRDSVQILISPYPLIAIQDFCQNENSGDTLRLDQGGVRLMIYRPQLESIVIELDADEYAALQKLAEGQPLGDTVQQVMQAHPKFDFQSFLQKHLSLETFRALSSNTAVEY